MEANDQRSVGEENIVDDTPASITEAGRKALEGTDLTPEERLILEIVSRCPGIRPSNAIEIAFALDEQYESPEAAVRALKSGAWRIKSRTNE